ncbi:hypothetical protein COY95_04740 [Candidatus Woesearchaeota archaeon CG_4_10_14_0_8_um_filter_47_5]|nr:MAG: hypothetical protein COY95_04740 [Candidatus Woesearchaeota archaeon CG_4_10_14_0_8_um_filter_47_5]
MVSVSLSPEVVGLMDSLIKKNPHFKNRPTLIEYLVFDYYEHQKELQAHADSLQNITRELRTLLQKGTNQGR